MTSVAYPRLRALRKPALLILALLALWFAAHNSKPRLLQSDFVPYWVAARLFISGGNPYSPSEVFQLEAQSDLSTRPRAWMMWNPPTAFAVTLPFGFLRFPIAATAWFLLQFAIVFVSSFWLWHLYRGPTHLRWLAIVLPGIFVPIGVALIDCQMTPLILLGVVAFLHFVERRSFALAGMLFALLALKPQLCLPLIFVLLLWCVRERKWQLLAGGLTAMTLLLLPVWFRPELVSQYRQIIPRIWDDAAPAWGGLLRTIFGYQRVWLQYLPVIPGIAWSWIYWKRRRSSWDWKERMPMLLLVGFIAAPYAWTYDEMILLPVFISSAIQLKGRNPGLARWVFAFYVLVNVVTFLLNLSGLRDVWYIWNAPLWLIAYILLTRHCKVVEFTTDPAHANAVQS